MAGILGNLFGRKQPAQGTIRASASRLTIDEFSENLVTIDELDFIGHFSKSPNGRFRLIWSDRNPEGTVGGYRTSGHGRWALLDDDRLLVSGQLERPNEGKVADSGTFILHDWLFGDGLNGRFVAYRPDGSEIVARDFAANLFTNGLSADGHFAICQTAHSPGSEDGCKLVLFDLGVGEEIVRWEPETTQWVENYEFDVPGRSVFLHHQDDERLGYRFDGTMIDREGWRTRRIARGDLFVIRDMVKELETAPSPDLLQRLFAGLEQAVAAGEIVEQARAWRLRGELNELMGEPREALEAYDRALSLDPQVGVSRRADKLRKELIPDSAKTSARKMSRFERQAERLGIEHEIVALESAGAKEWRLGPMAPWASVEEAALAHYVAQGWSGAAAEGGLILTLIKAASFPRLSPRHADTFIEALYAQNVAFDDDRFDPAGLVENVAGATLGQIERNWQVISATAGRTPAFYPRVYWEEVRGLFEELGPQRLAEIAGVFAGASYDLRAGWPDLTLWKDGEVRFVEVKAPSDSMHAKQARLITTLLLPLRLRVGLAEAMPVAAGSRQ